MTFKKILWRLSASLMAQSILAPASLATTYEVTPNMRTCAVVRKRASVRAVRLDCLQAGSEVKVISYNPRGYSEVSINGKRRYVWGKFLTKVDDKVAPPSSGPTKRYVNRREPAPAAPPAVADDELVSQTPFGPQNPRGRKKPSIHAEPAPASEAATPATSQSAETIAVGGQVEEVKPSTDIPEIPVSMPSTDVVQSKTSPDEAKPVDGSLEEIKAEDVPDEEQTELPKSNPSCPAVPDIYASVLSVAKKGAVLPKNTRYNLKGKPKGNPGHGTLVMSGDKIEVKFGPGNEHHCSSFTGVAFFKHLADLHNSGKIKLEKRHIDYLNSGPVFHAIYGGTFSMAALYKGLGGSFASRSIGEEVLDEKGKPTGKTYTRKDLTALLASAQPGDSLKYDRKNGMGHSTFYQRINWKAPGEFCYISSIRNNTGKFERCEPLDVLQTAVVARLPADVSVIPGKLDEMMKDNKVKEMLYLSNFKTSKGGELSKRSRKTAGDDLKKMIGLTQNSNLKECNARAVAGVSADDASDGQGAR